MATKPMPFAPKGPKPGFPAKKAGKKGSKPPMKGC